MTFWDYLLAPILFVSVLWSPLIVMLVALFVVAFVWGFTGYLRDVYHIGRWIWVIPPVVSYMAIVFLFWLVANFDPFSWELR